LNKLFPTHQTTQDELNDAVEFFSTQPLKATQLKRIASSIKRKKLYSAKARNKFDIQQIDDNSEQNVVN